MPNVWTRGLIDPCFVGWLFKTSQMCLSSSTAPSVIRKIVGMELWELDNISRAWECKRKKSIGVDRKLSEHLSSKMKGKWGTGVPPVIYLNNILDMHQKHNCTFKRYKSSHFLSTWCWRKISWFIKCQLLFCIFLSFLALRSFFFVS